MFSAIETTVDDDAGEVGTEADFVGFKEVFGVDEAERWFLGVVEVDFDIESTMSSFAKYLEQSLSAVCDLIAYRIFY